MCEVNGRRLLAWMDGEMEGREGDEIAAHVRDCPECKAGVQQFRAISAEVVEYRDRIAHPGESQSSRGRQWIRAAAIAAVVLLAILISRGVSGVDRHSAASVPPDLTDAAHGAPLTVIRVAVPIDEILPPGAAPAGISLQGDLVLAQDGTPVAIRLAP
jgi:anti-sigma factor RsiW